MGLFTELKDSITRATDRLFAGSEPKRIGIYGPPNAGKCLAASEPVQLADGSYQEIQCVFDQVVESVPSPVDASIEPDEQWIECSVPLLVPAVGDELNINPKQVSHVFRQRYSGPMYRVTTELGRTTTVSPEHPFLVPGNRDTATFTPARNLTTGESIALIKSYQPTAGGSHNGTVDGVATDGGSTVHHRGHYGHDLSSDSDVMDIDSLVTDIFHRNELENPQDASLPKSILAADDYVVAEFIENVIEESISDGQVTDCVQITHESRDVIAQLQMLLNRFGISARISSTRGGQYTLQISQSDRQILKNKSADSLGEYPSKLAPGHGTICWDTIATIEIIDYDGYIYDLTVPDDHTFVTGDGIVVHNTTLANRIARDWTGDAIGPESHVPHETRRARRKENVEIERNGRSVTIDVVDTPGVTTKVDYKEFLDFDMEKEDAIRRSREATEGVAEAMHWLREDVDGVIYVLDSANDPFTQVNTMLIGIIESRDLPVLIFANKIDLEDSSVQRIANAFPQHETVPLSALEGENMDEVYDKIAEYFG